MSIGFEYFFLLKEDIVRVSQIKGANKHRVFHLVYIINVWKEIYWVQKYSRPSGVTWFIEVSSRAPTALPERVLLSPAD